MKSLFFSITLTLACWNGVASAETHDYQPLLEQGRQWTYAMMNDRIMDDPGFYYDFYTLTLRGDTTIDGKTYMKCYYESIWSGTYGELANTNIPVAYLREDGNKVYVIKHPFNQIFGLDPALPEGNYIERDDWLEFSYWMYDFDDMNNCNGDDEPLTKTVVTINGKRRNKFKNYCFTIIEGIGPDGRSNLITPICRIYTDGGISQPRGLVSMHDGNGNILYKGTAYNAYKTWKGDVNADRQMNVSDVTTLVNMILGVAPVGKHHADINGDGKINVSDITALINLLLGVK